MYYMLTLHIVIKMSIFSKNKFSEKNGNVYIFENSFNTCLH